MSMLHHWSDEDEPTPRQKVERYVKSVENDSMASLAEWRTVHDNAEFMEDEEFCKHYNL